MMPSPVQHRDPHLWGDDKDIFNHRRFVDSESQLRRGAFRAFGGGTTLCPGRHFATVEILAFAAIMAMQFDIEPTSGCWNRSLKTNAEFWEATLSPVEDFEVEIRLTESEMPTRKWTYVLSDSDQAVALSAEDEEIAGKMATSNSFQGKEGGSQ